MHLTCSFSCRWHCGCFNDAVYCWLQKQLLSWEYRSIDTFTSWTSWLLAESAEYSRKRSLHGQPVRVSVGTFWCLWFWQPSFCPWSAHWAIYRLQGYCINVSIVWRMFEINDGAYSIHHPTELNYVLLDKLFLRFINSAKFHPHNSMGSLVIFTYFNSELINA